MVNSKHLYIKLILIYLYYNGETIIEYFDKNNTFRETIVKLDSTELFLTNKENYIYHYKVYEKLNLD